MAVRTRINIVNALNENSSRNCERFLGRQCKSTWFNSKRRLKSPT